MALFNRQNNSDIPPELRPYYDAPAPASRNWVRWLIRALIVIVVAVLLFFLIRFAWHIVHNNSGETSKPVTSNSRTQKQSTPKTDNNGASDTQSSSTSASSNQSAATNTQTSTNSSSAATSSQPATAGTKSNTALTNTGPGSTISLFIISAVAGAVAWQYRLRRKFTA